MYFTLNLFKSQLLFENHKISPSLSTTNLNFQLHGKKKWGLVLGVFLFQVFEETLESVSSLFSAQLTHQKK